MKAFNRFFILLITVATTGGLLAVGVLIASGVVTSSVLVTSGAAAFPRLVYAQPITTDISQLSPALYHPGELIVQFEAGNNPDDIAQAIQVRAARSDNPIGILQNVQEDALSTLRGEDTPEELQNRLSQINRTYEIVMQTGSPAAPDTYIIALDDTASPDELAQAAEAYAALPTEYIQPNFKYYISATPNDPQFPQQWGFAAVRAPQAWDMQKGSRTIKVAVIDTGIDRNHPDLVQNTLSSLPIAPGCIHNGDSHGHGTHVAGVIGATTQNAAHVAGLNWNVSLLGYCVVSPSGVGTSLTISQGIRRAIADGAHVINLSLGGPILPGMDPSLENALADAAGAGITIVAAAGNCGTLPPGQHPSRPDCFWGQDANKYLPGASVHTISVAAIGPQSERAVYSNIGSTVDIAAPGGNPPAGSSSCSSDGSNCIVSTWDRFRPCVSTGSLQATCPMSGTSMAAPHVAGVAALLEASQQSLSPSAIRSILTSTADDLGPAGKDPQFGHGRLNAFEALQQVSGGPSPVSTVPPTGVPTSVPSVTPIDCAAQKSQGDYDCNGAVNLGDFERWRQDYTNDRSTLAEFEAWRAAYTAAK